MNILLTSVGRRDYLIRYFRDALGGKGIVIAANSTPDTSAMATAEVSYVVPPASSPDYIEAVLAICRRHQVRLILSLHDWESPFLAANASRFSEIGISLAVSDSAVLNVCLDKLETYRFATANGFDTPYTVAGLDALNDAVEAKLLTFPVIMKPRYGQGSVGVELIEERWEAEVCYRRAVRNIARTASNNLLNTSSKESILFQQYIQGTEHGLEVVNDLKGCFAACFSKRKEAMRAGETDVAETIDDPVLTSFGEQVSSILKHVGVLDVDILSVKDRHYLLEMNPRFGGQYPFSHIAGANIPACLIAWASGIPIDPNWLKIQSGIKAFKGVTITQASPSRLALNTIAK